MQEVASSNPASPTQNPMETPKNIVDMTEEELYFEWRDLFNQYRNGPNPVLPSTRARFTEVSAALREKGFFKGSNPIKQ